MKKNYLQISVLFLFSLLAIIGCQKETSEAPPKLTEESLAQKGNAKSEKKSDCRLTVFDFYDGVADYHQIDYFSYKNGLVDEWLTFYGSLFKMQYDRRGKLKISEVYNSGALAYTIHFFYENGNAVKEIWYVGNTTDIDDEVYHTYNRKGQIITTESKNYGYYVENTWTQGGDLKSWFLYFGGLPNVKAEYVYRHHYKNPLMAKPGAEYSFPYVNAAFGTGKRWYSSEKMTFYDENGNPSVYYDQDPGQTTWQIGNNRYPELVSYFSPVSGSNHSVGFGYENCEGDNNGHHRPNVLTRKNPAVSAAQSNSIRSILSGPRDKLKQKVYEFRQEMKKRSKN